MKTIVTHFAPDVDAVSSVWVLKRFLPGWEDAEVAFCPAGKTLENMIVDSDPEILHVDTGMGMLDHHQMDEDTCAARLCLEYVKKELSEGVFKSNSNKRNVNPLKNGIESEAIERLIDIVNNIDHFREVYYPNAMADFYDFGLVAEMDGWKLIYPDQHHKLIDLGMTALDGIFKTFQNKVWAETEIKKTGLEFETGWGKGIGLETLNDEAVRIAQRMGFVVAIRKDPKKAYVRVKAQPESAADLTICYNMCKKIDPGATWFLHASRKMLLNGSIKNPDSKPTKLTLREVIDIVKEASNG